MMIDLNAVELQPKSIFNDGKAGLAKNVTIEVTKKQADEADNRPDYNLVITDENGGVLRQGVYYFTPSEQKSVEQNQAALIRELTRYGTIVAAGMGDKPVFPQWSTAKEAYDGIFAMVAKATEGKKFNVYVTFGTTNYANKNGYLKLRYFDFVELAGTEPTRLRAKKNDLMERIEPDAQPSNPFSEMTQDNPTANVESWTS